MKEIRGRFAPSPSGPLHLGNLFCGLLSWLSAKKQNGAWVLRIEDLDPLRSYPEQVESCLAALRWFGLDFDEGPEKEGLCAPYFQGARTALYQQAFEKLTAKGLVYPCFCSRAELHAASAPHLSDGSVVYSGRCAGLTREQAAEKAKKRPPAFRLRVPDETIVFEDGVYGEVRQDLRAECGDFILRRSDGVFAYQLAVTVDDALMGMTEVVRGRDLLASTPRQLYLYRLLGYKPPRFYHIPLLLDENGARLAKREGALGLAALQKRFKTPEKLLGRLAFAAGLIDRPAPLTAQELAREFSWEKLKREDVRLPPGFYKP
ncbi:MAG: tRNA glutamyl-Q(34) synthetase GluQRS [Oscillospiraceae bacterium]|nr:tRNA glutamyl-Q(34) synthetase GluQRS [Oscillospiraceae bacterium]